MCSGLSVASDLSAQLCKLDAQLPELRGLTSTACVQRLAHGSCLVNINVLPFVFIQPPNTPRKPPVSQALFWVLGMRGEQENSLVPGEAEWGPGGPQCDVRHRVPCCGDRKRRKQLRASVRWCGRRPPFSQKNGDTETRAEVSGGRAGSCQGPDVGRAWQTQGKSRRLVWPEVSEWQARPAGTLKATVSSWDFRSETLQSLQLGWTVA